MTPTSETPVCLTAIPENNPPCDRAADLVQAARRAGWPTPYVLVFAPGRINLLEYMDMLQARQVSFAIEQGIWSLSAPRTGPEALIRMQYLSRDIRVDLRRTVSALREKARTGQDWRSLVWSFPHPGRLAGDPVNYVVAPMARLLFAHPGAFFQGLSLMIESSDLPRDSGLSSSSAVVVSAGLHFLAHNPRLLAPLPGPLGSLFGESEWYVGTRGGANDHITMLRAKPGCWLVNDHAKQPVATGYIPFPASARMYLLDSLWPAAKSRFALAGFNRVQARFAELQHAMVRLAGSAPFLGGYAPAAIERAGARLRQGSEAERSLEAVLRFYQLQERFCTELVQATGQRDWPRYITHWVNRLQRNLSRNLHTSNSYMDRLHERVNGLPGVMGAKMVGAGFGGALLVFADRPLEAAGLLQHLIDAPMVAAFQRFVPTIADRPEEQKKLLRTFAERRGQPGGLLPVQPAAGVKIMRCPA